MDNVDHRKIFALINRHGESELLGKIRSTKYAFRFANRRDRACQHHLDGIFHQAALERLGLPEKFFVPRVIAVTIWVVPIERFEHDLVFPWTVEYHRRAVSPGKSHLQNSLGSGPGQKVPQARLAILRP